MEPRPTRVLVVDDKRNIRATLRMFLEALGCEVREATGAEAALAPAPADLAFVDLRLGTTSGLELIPALLAELPTLDIVLITAYATFDTAVDAVRRGARDYLSKPFTPACIGGIEVMLRERTGAQVPRRTADRGRPSREPSRWTGRAAP